MKGLKGACMGMGSSFDTLSKQSKLDNNRLLGVCHRGVQMVLRVTTGAKNTCCCFSTSRHRRLDTCRRCASDAFVWILFVVRGAFLDQDDRLFYLDLVIFSLQVAIFDFFDVGIIDVVVIVVIIVDNEIWRTCSDAERLFYLFMQSRAAI